MSDTNYEFPGFIVERPNQWNDNAVKTFDHAVEQAKKKTYSNGNEYGIYKLVFSTVKPEQVNNVQIKAVE